MPYQPKAPKVSKLSVAISLTLHGGVLAVLLLVAAHEGVFGKRPARIVVTMIPKPHPIEQPVKPAVEKPDKIVQAPMPVESAPISKPAQQVPPPPVNPPSLQPMTVVPSKPSAAPAVANPPVFLFGGGASIESSSDPGVLYKGFLEYSLRSNWRRPANIVDAAYMAEVEVAVDPTGQITGYEWEKGSGNARWDDSVRAALAQTKALDRPPPKGFPEKVLVRFDVQTVTDALKP